MKNLALLWLSVTLLTVGCTGNDKTGAGLDGSVTAAAAATPVSAESRAQAVARPDPAANGGSNLQAGAPYQGSGPVTQNVNAAPFLIASQAQASPAPATTKASRKKAR